MKISLYEDNCLKEDRVDIHYRKMNNKIDNIITYINKNNLLIEGVMGDEKHIIPIEDIYYFDTVDKKTFAYLKENVLQIKYKLNDIEEGLGSYGFVRISKSIIVNVYKIKRLKSEVNMRINAWLKNDELLVINRHYKKSFHKKLNEIKNRLEV